MRRNPIALRLLAFVLLATSIGILRAATVGSNVQVDPRWAIDVDLAADPLNANHVVATATTQDGSGSILTRESFDGGATWSSRDFTPDGASTTGLQSTLAFNRAGDLFLTATDGLGNLRVVRRGAGSVADDAPVTLGTGASLPRIAIDKSPLLPNPIYVAWAAGSAINVSHSTDNGQTFTKTRVDDGGSSVVKFAQTAVGPDGEVYAAWTALSGSTIVLRADRSDNGGSTWGADRLVHAFTSPSAFNLRALVPGNFANLSASLDVDRSNGPNRGTVYAAYCDGAADASSLGCFLQHSTDGGATWSAPLSINSVANGYQMMPKVAVDETDGTVSVIWYSNIPGGNAADWEIDYTRSNDGGLSVEPQTRVTNRAGLDPYQSFGDNLGLAAAGSAVYAAWPDDRSGDEPRILSSTITLPAADTSPNFSLDAAPSPLTVAPGTSAAVTVSSTVWNGFSSAIALSVSGLPAGATAQVLPTSIGAPGSGASWLKISAGATTPPGTYTLTIAGSGGGIGRTTLVTLEVAATSAAQSTVTVSTSAGSATYGDSMTIIAAVTGASGTPAGSVTFTASGEILAADVPLDATGKASITSTRPRAGTIVVAAGYKPSDVYLPNAGSTTLTVAKRLVTLVADDKTRVYGNPIPTLTYQVNGFVNGDTVASAGFRGSASLTTQAEVDCIANNAHSYPECSTPVGTYPINVSPATLAADNYVFTGVAGTITVTKGELRRHVMPASRAYGTPNPAFQYYLWSGFKYLDDAFDLGFTLVSGTSTATTSATPASPAGTYPITVTGNMTARNYNIVYINDVLTVTKVPLTVSAANVSAPYGLSTPPAYTATYSGFTNGEGPSTAGITGAPTFSSGATAASLPGSTYSISVSIGTLSAPNYTFSAAGGGTLTIVKAPLTIRADDKSRPWGEINPTLTTSISGFVNGQTLATSGVTGSPAVATAATQTSAQGTYAITPAVGTLSSSNYSFVYVNGTLTVTRAVLTVRADNKHRDYGAANPALTWTYSGFMTGESLGNSGITGSPAAVTPATPSSDAGDYPISITAGTLSSTKYLFTFVDATLTVDKILPQIIWQTPAPIEPGTALGPDQLNASTSVPGSFTYVPPAGTVLTGTSVVNAVFTPADTVKYSEAQASMRVIVNGGTPEPGMGAGVPEIAWPVPAAIAQGTPLGAAQLDASTSVLGSFSYSPAAGTVLSPGSHTLSVTFTPVDQDTYAVTTAQVVLRIDGPKALPSVRYEPHAVPPVGDEYDEMSGLTNSGAVAGTAHFFNYDTDQEYTRAFRYENGAAVLLDTPEGDGSESSGSAVLGIGSNGEPFGITYLGAYDSDLGYGHDQHPSIWHGTGERTDLSSGFTSITRVGSTGHALGMDLNNRWGLYADGSFSELPALFSATAINGADQVAGNLGSEVSLYSDGEAGDVGVPGYPVGVTEAGSLIGNWRTLSGTYNAFRSDGVSLHLLGSLGADSSTVSSVNPAGPAVGALYRSGLPTPFLYRNGVVTALGSLGGGYASETAVNAAGQVIGLSSTSGGTQVPFIYTDGGMYNLNDLLVANSAWQIVSVSGINDAGQILGTGMLHGVSTTFVADPIGAGKIVPEISWDTPSAIPQGTALDNSQLNATSTVPGTFSYLPPAGIVLLPGTHTLTAIFTPTDGDLYAQNSTTVDIVVTAPPPIVASGPTHGVLMRQLPVPDSNTQFRYLSAAGEAVGNAFPTDPETGQQTSRGVRYKNGVTTYLELPPGATGSVVNGMAANGDAFGYVFTGTDDDSSRQAVVWRQWGYPQELPGTLQAINADGVVGGIDGNGSFLYQGNKRIDLPINARGFNASLQVVGFLGGDSALYSNGLLKILPHFGDFAGAALGITDAGVIVGQGNVGGGAHAFVSDGVSAQDIGTLGARDAQVVYISPAGPMAGWLQSPGTLDAFLYKDGVMTRIDRLGGLNAQPSGVNSSGEVIGGIGLTASTVENFLFRDGTTYKLNDLIAPGSGWAVEELLAINDRGQMLLDARNGGQRAYFIADQVRGDGSSAAPIAADDSASVNENGSLSGQVLTNDTDPDGGTLTAALVATTQHGTLTLAADGSFVYVPTPRYSGPDSFTYTAHNRFGNGNVATVSITVLPVNEAPVAESDSLALLEDEPLATHVNADDPDGDELTFSVVASPAHGTLALSADGSFTYTPAADYNGNDAFTFTASDGELTSNTATFDLLITPVNDAPVASGGSATSIGEQPIAGILSAFDIDGDAISFEIAAAPSHGSITLGANGAFTFVPDASYAGIDSFTFRAFDGSLASAPATINLSTVAMATATSLTVPAGPFIYGRAVVITAAVSAGGGPIANGTVSFADGGNVFAAGIPLTGGAASVATPVLDAGAHTFTAAFDPTYAHGASSGTAMINIGRAPLMVVAANADRGYWDAAPILSGTMTGLYAGDGVSASYTTTAAADSPAGTYPIQIALLDPLGRLGNYTVAATPGTLTISNPRPTLASLTPLSAGAGDPDTSVDLAGNDFVPSSVASVNGTPVETEFVSRTLIRALVPTAMIAAPGAKYVTVANGAPGGGVSNASAFIVSDTGALVSSSDTKTASGGTATATTGGIGPGTSGSVTATGTGAGTITVARYDGNPTDPTGFSVSGGYFDVAIAPGSSFSSVVVLTCALEGGTSVRWFDGTAWQPVQAQSYDASTQCATLTLGAASSPTIAQLTGTYFAAVVVPPPNDVTPGAMNGSGMIKSGNIRTRFEFTAREKASGADRGKLRIDVRTPAVGKGKNRQPSRVDRFVSDALSSVVFSDDPASKPGKKAKPTTDTVVFTGTGRLNGQGGLTFEVRAVDRGEPGRNKDEITLTIRNGSIVVLSVDGTIDGGNIQSTRIR